jgi:RNA polymerase sigma factor for flagellar operon FliA
MIISETIAAETETPSYAKSRDELILEHLPQVKLIAKRIQKSLPASVTLDDLISSGIVGLIAAVDRYDPKQEVKLKTYAEYKIKGAILDSLRMLDWAPREKRKRARLIETATSDLEKEHCRTPREEEVASKLGMPLKEYLEWLKDAPRTQENGNDLLSCVSSSIEQWPSELFERAELERLVRQCIEKMRPIERTVLRLYFYEERTLRDIANTVDLHESRISQLKSQAISRLRSHLQIYWTFERGVLPGRVEHQSPAAGMR